MISEKNRSCQKGKDKNIVRIKIDVLECNKLDVSGGGGVQIAKLLILINLLIFNLILLV